MQTATLSSPAETEVFYVPSRTHYVAAAVILAAHVPVVLAHCQRLWNYEHYRYYPFLLGSFAVLLWNRFTVHELGPDRKKVKLLSILMLLAGLSLLSISVVFWSPWLGTVAAIFSVGGLLLAFGGPEAPKVLLPVWLLLWFMIPLPNRWDVHLVFSLQTLTSKAGSYLLDFFHFNHLLSGHVLEVPGHRFLVEEACSGIKSLFSLVAFTAIGCVWGRRSVLHSGLLLLSAAGWAMLVNTLRVSAVVIAYDRFQWDISSGTAHEVLGLVLFAFALLMLWSTDCLLLFFLMRLVVVRMNDDDEAPLPLPPPKHRVAIPPSWLGMSTAAGMFALVGAVQFLFVGKDMQDAQLQHVLTADYLPARIGSWNQIGFETEERSHSSNWGRYSALWTYQSDGIEVVIRYDYPFTGWHSLTECYWSQGWQLGRTQADAEIVQVNLHQTDELHGFLLYGLLDGQGEPVPPPGSPLASSWWQSLMRSRLAYQSSRAGLDAASYQCQAFVSTTKPLSSSQRNRVRELYMASRDRLAHAPRAAGSQARRIKKKA